MQSYEIFLLVLVGIPLGLAAIWIVGFVLSMVAAPFIAAYEDVYGWARHPRVHRSMRQRGRDLRAFAKRAGHRTGLTWRSMIEGIRRNEWLRHPFSRRAGRVGGQH